MSFGRLGAVGRGFGRMGAGGKSVLTGNSSTVQQYLNRLPTPLSSSDEAIVAAYIDGLVSDGVWSRLDFLHLYVTADAANWPVNLISSSFTASLASGVGNPPTWTSRAGIAGHFGASTYVDSNFNPSTAGGNYSQSDAMICCWCSAPASALAGDLFQQDTTVELFPRNSPDNKIYIQINDSTEGNVANGNDGTGFWLLQRTTSNSRAVYRNDVQQLADSAASVPLANANIVFLTNTFTGLMAAAGKSLNSSQRTAFYNRTLTAIQGLTLGALP